MPASSRSTSSRVCSIRGVSSGGVLIRLFGKIVEIVGRNVRRSVSVSCEAGRAGLSLRASRDELASLIDLSVGKTFELAAFSSARS